MVDKTLRITDVSLVLDLLSPRKAAKLGMVPLMHSSWNQIIEELEEFLKLKDLVGVQGFKGILLRIMTRACCVFKI